MKYKIIFVLFIFFVVGCIGGVSTKDSITDQYFSQRRKSMDILELLDTLTYVANDTVNLPYPSDVMGNWANVRNIKQINWVSDGKKNDGDENFGNYLITMRGELYITMDSAFTNLDVERDGPSPWELTVSGVPHGYLYITLENNGLFDDFCGFEYFFADKKVLVNDSDLPYKWRKPSHDPYTKMEVKIKNRVITVYQLTSEGSAGCSTTLFLNSTGSREKLHPKSVEE